MSTQNWPEVMANIEASLVRSLQAAAAREQATQIALEEAHALEAARAAWQQQLQHCAERVQQLQALSRQAADQAAEIDRTLAEGEQSLERWLDAAGVARQQLAERQGGAVG